MAYAIFIIEILHFWELIILLTSDKELYLSKLSI